jgi:hypothetical protein
MFAQVRGADVLFGSGTLGTLVVIQVARLMFDGIRPGRLEAWV